MSAMYCVTACSACVRVFYLYVERVKCICVFMISVTMRCVADFIVWSDMEM